MNTTWKLDYRETSPSFFLNSKIQANKDSICKTALDLRNQKDFWNSDFIVKFDCKIEPSKYYNVLFLTVSISRTSINVCA